MGTKQSPGNFDCYAAAADDEPMFILLARDPMAPVLVNVWADLRRFAVEQGQKPSSDLAKVLEAKGCAEAMEIWRAKRRAPK